MLGTGAVSSGSVPALEQRMEGWKVPLVLRLFSPLKTGVAWVWDVIVLRMEKDGLALILIFLGALGIFPFWIGVAMAVGGVVLIAFGNASAEQELVELRKQNEKWIDQRTRLEEQLLELLNQRDAIRISHEVVGTQKNQAEDLLETVTRERGEFSLQVTQLKWGQKQWEREKGELEKSLEREVTVKNQLLEGKSALEKEKRTLEEKCVQIMKELAALQLQQERSEGSSELQQSFAEFDPNHGDLNPLILSWIKRREALRTMMQTAIGRLQTNSSLRIAAEGILQLSEEEGDWLQQMAVVLPKIPLQEEV